MDHTAVFSMKFSKVFPLLIVKAKRKGRTKEEVCAVTEWLTGYKSAEPEQLLRTEPTYGDFFEKAPCLNETHRLIQGSVCGCAGGNHCGLTDAEHPLSEQAGR